MKQVIKSISLAFLAASLSVPTVLLAQDDKDKEVKEKKEAEQIIITRKGNKDEKIVVEVTGDKVLVNGKEVKDKEGDVTVRRQKIKDVWAFGGDGPGSTWNAHGDQLRMYSLNENRAMLGVSTEPHDEGAEIQNVTEGSAAEKAGLKEGDIITKVNETKIETPDDLSEAIRDHKPGEKVKISYLRDKKKQDVTAELGKWKGAQAFSFGDGHNFDLDLENLAPKIQGIPRVYAPGQNHNYNYRWNWSGNGPRLGVSVQDTEDGKGVNVIEVDEDGNAAKAGIREDDVITEVDGKAVNSADEIAKLIKESKEKTSVKVKLLRKGKSETVDVKIPRKLKKADL